MLGHPTYATEGAARIRNTWIEDGRLRGLPRKRSRRLPLLDLIARDFEPGESYTYDDVMNRLEQWFDDTATLGRYLVDEGFLDRFPDGSRWWRCGGTVTPADDDQPPVAKS